MSEYNSAWKFVYATYPRFLRVLERIGIHSGRQEYLLGTLNPKYLPEDLEKRLLENGFEPAVLAWKDSDEVFGLRKVDKHVYQWHVRLYSDGEIRGHYEYSSEGNPVGHVFSSAFRRDDDTLIAMLDDYLVR